MEPVWRQGITGSGIVVTVVDEGESRQGDIMSEN